MRARRARRLRAPGACCLVSEGVVVVDMANIRVVNESLWNLRHRGTVDMVGQVNRMVKFLVLLKLILC